MSRDAVEHGLAWSWTPARVLKSVKDNATNVAVARDGSRLVGFAIMKYREQEAHLLLFAVHAAYRRRGVGSALLAWLEPTVRNAGIGLICLESRARNTSARAFYRNHGYTEIGLLKGYYHGQEDGVRISKVLWFHP